MYYFRFTLFGGISAADQLYALDGKHVYDLTRSVSDTFIGGARRPYLTANLDLSRCVQIIDRFNDDSLHTDHGIRVWSARS